MTTNEKCPLDGSWLQTVCDDYKSNKNHGSLHECPHQDACAELRVQVESDVNASTTATKWVLVNHLPHAFDKSQMQVGNWDNVFILGAAVTITAAFTAKFVLAPMRKNFIEKANTATKQ